MTTAPCGSPTMRSLECSPASVRTTLDSADRIDQVCRESGPEPPTPEVSTIDEMVDSISRYYTYRHPYSCAMPNPKIVRAALKTFHRANPEWSLFRMSTCIENIYCSADSYVNKANSPDVWIKRLPEFSAGPLGDFGHVFRRASRLDGAIVSTS